MTPATKKPIQTPNQRVVVEGNVFYTDKRRRIDLKKPIRDLIQQSLKPVAYKMEICLCPESTLQRCQELVGQKVLPVLLYFEEEEA